MSWVKIDDGFTDHPKIESLSADAFRLHVAGLCYCARTLSDGVIPTDRVRRLLPKVSKAWLTELVDGDLWLPHPKGYEVKDYLKYNPSREKVQAEREQAAERKRKWQEARDARKNGVPNTVPNAVKNGGGNASPPHDPPRPAPKGLGAGGCVTTDDVPDTALPPETVELGKAALRLLRQEREAS